MLRTCFIFFQNSKILNIKISQCTQVLWNDSVSTTC